ncbi:glutamate racemase [Sinomicrobium soli]|uniref:glutamate racemase n=1 Tax=Sinomicrobium sp. N-1-3-6 TaxID=2219864 RepID=UPI000DCD27DA|nr:glutamate racemase [Sinomicrobium sp. N-1-3-6]RAV27567.1 glutamate racemase [Sinomicrobium sp. N-1-3-6]
MHIAFFDSGVGGLTVLHEAIQRMPGERFIYFGDSHHAPYGTKTREEITELVFRACAFLAEKKLKALVVACNTATSVAVKALRDTYDFPIIGMEPAIKPAVESSDDKRVLVCATDLTLKEEKLDRLVQDLNAGDKVDYLSLQGLVLLAERFQLDAPETEAYLRHQLSGIPWSRYHAIVLGCTHFIYFREQIRRLIAPHVRILDGNRGTVNNLMTRVHPESSPEKKEIQYFISGQQADAGHFDKYLDYLTAMQAL